MKSGKQRKLEIKSARLRRTTRIQNHPSPLPVDVYSPGIAVFCDATRLARPSSIRHLAVMPDVHWASAPPSAA
jgi:hypothetical protein